jgi:N-acetylglucosaminyldiphosphoundecaprenol N-acetyl-beta-D-mannosaminyltransferase
MTNNYFGVNLEFNHPALFERINRCIEHGPAGYICVVDANVLTMARKDESYGQVINQSLVNTCDGSSIAFFAGKLHGKSFRALNGPDIFAKLLQNTQLKHLLLGNTAETCARIRQLMEEQGLDSTVIQHLELPFLSVEEFNYEQIAAQINTLRPDVIWVSLGAPKQERFMHCILPYLNHGVMFGIGAAFNFYIGEIKMSKVSLFGLRFIWVNRIMSDPVRLTRRLVPYVLSIPGMLYSEYKMLRNG